jgi:hypothetical protein
MDMKIPLWIIVMLLAVTCAAQEKPVQQPEDQEEQKTVPSEDLKDENDVKIKDQNAGKAAIPFTNRNNIDDPSRGAYAFAEDIVKSSRNLWGFSLSAYEAYSTDAVPGIQKNEDATITSLAPSIFLNIGRRKTKLHIDFGSGYRLYRHHKDLNGWNYSGSVKFSSQFSRIVSLQLSNLLTSSANDASSIFSFFPSIRNDYPSNSREVLFDDRQRMTRNSMQAKLDFQLSRRARLGLTGGYDLFSYEQVSLTNTNAVRIGADFEYKLAKWLDFSSSYYDYLNKVDDSRRDVQIHRLKVGGLNLNLTRFWRIWTGGGIDFSQYRGLEHFKENVDVGIRYGSRNTTLSATYNRGLSSASGLSRLMHSDAISVELGNRITSRVSSRLTSYYTRSSESLAAGTLKTLAGNASLEFALRNDLFLSLNSSYQNQQQSNFSYGGLQVNRFSAYVSLQYVWPSRRRSDY